MNFANLYFNHCPTYKIMANCLTRYGHFCRWKDHKETILDVGCGDGKVTEKCLYPYAKDHVEKLVAIDKDNEMIKFAKEHSQIRDIEYRLTDAMAEKTTNKFESRFDKIFTFAVAQWFPDNTSFFLNLRKMLKDYGQIFVVTLSDHCMRQSYIKQNKEGSWYKYLGHRQPFVDYTTKPEEYLKKSLQNAGFQVDCCKNDKEYYSVDNGQEFIRALVYMSGDLEKIPPELREDYIADHWRNCCEQMTYLGEPYRYDLPYETITGVVTKIT